ncbi:FkbM family methyltransferase [Lysinibacillus fusiformis]|uniref:FkbM family methyltransferase n=1 Tax=Lysinibacillus fusiformis TaxID=28031 RepID=UPI003CFFDA6A
MKYLIFGANVTGQTFFENYLNKIEIVGVVDREIKKYSKHFEGIGCWSNMTEVPSNILENINVILVASSSIKQSESIKFMLQRIVENLNINVVSIFEIDFYADFMSTLSRESRVTFFKEKKGDITYRLDYDDLNKDSIVIDLGGYMGQWTSDIYSKYNANVFVFEPIPEYCEFIKKRFEKNPKIKVYECGLADRQYISKIYLNEDATTTFGDIDSPYYNVELIEYSNFMKTNNLNTIDLIKINIEGGEFDLLDSIIKNDDVKNFKHIQVQFHDFVPNSDIRRENIRQELKKTHKLTYNYDFVWENWSLKS